MVYSIAWWKGLRWILWLTKVKTDSDGMSNFSKLSWGADWGGVEGAPGGRVGGGGGGGGQGDCGQVTGSNSEQSLTLL